MWLISLLFCLALVAYAHVGYPVLMFWLARQRPNPPRTDGSLPVGISIVMSVFNAEARIEERLKNLLACQWTGELEILVFCDGCTDATARLVREVGNPSIRVIEGQEQRGKASALSEAVPQAIYPIVVLCDARQDFHPDALMELVRPFSDPQVGAVSGLLEIASSTSGSGQGVDVYWKIERKLREWEGIYDSVIGCTGAICAIRRDLFLPLHPTTILDDVVIPMGIAVQGKRVLYEPKAIAWDPQALEPRLEKRRKLRTLAGNFQMIEQFPEWMLPWKNRLWWQLISHKYLRLAVPWLLLAILLFSVLASANELGHWILWGQMVAYAAALIGLMLPGLRIRLLTVPAGFVLLQWTCLRALIAYLRSRRDALSLWQAAPSKPAP